MKHAEVPELRRFSREVVRELGFLKPHVSETGTSHSQCHALLELHHHGRLTSAHLSSLLRLDKSTTSRLIDKLLEEDWVKASEQSSDKRYRPLTLTAKGIAKVEQINNYANGQVNSALGLLTAKERTIVVEGMAFYAKALSKTRLRNHLSLRPIRTTDDPEVARIVRKVMTEFNCVGPGFAISDPEVDAMHATYTSKRHKYFVVTDGEKLLGGGGVGPLAGAEPDVCELRKMYFLPEARGLGVGRMLLDKLVVEAIGLGYRKCYLETRTIMGSARRLYESSGFTQLSCAMGQTGHFSCDTWYLKTLVSKKEAK